MSRWWSGRFDRIIEIPLPDFAARLAILSIHVRKVPLAPDVSLKSMAQELEGATGADIAFVVREAAYASMRRILGEKALSRGERLTDKELSLLVVGPGDFQLAMQALRSRGAHMVEDDITMK